LTRWFWSFLMTTPNPQTRTPRNLPPQRNMPSMLVGIVAATLVGAVIGAIGQGWHWPDGMKPPAGSLQQAEEALHDGNDKDAVALFTRLADQNNGDAQYWLGYMTEHGIGVRRDPAKAVDLYKKAAAHDVVAAELRLGEIYLDGNLVLPDFQQAKSYLETAAYRGDSRAAMVLGRMYRDGLGMSADPIQAYAWSEVATLEGNPAGEVERDAAIGKVNAADQQAAIAKATEIYAQIKQRTAPPKGGAT
jgi:Sel1 repeat